MKEETIAKIFISIFLIIGLIIFGVFISFKIKESQTIKNYAQTTGYYFNREIYSSDDNGETYALIYQYIVNNQAYTITTNYGTTSIPPKNSKKTIYYNPDDPNEAILKGSSQASGLLVLLGTLFTCFPILILSELFNKNERVKKIILGLTFFLVGASLYYFVANDVGSFHPLIVFKTNILAAIMSIIFMLLGIIVFIEKYLPQPKNKEKITKNLIDNLDNIDKGLNNFNNIYKKYIKYMIMVFLSTTIAIFFTILSLKSDIPSKLILIPCIIACLYFIIYGVINIVYNNHEKAIPSIFHNLYIIIYFLPFFGLISLFLYGIVISNSYFMLIVIIPIILIITYAIIQKIKLK